MAYETLIDWRAGHLSVKFSVDNEGHVWLSSLHPVASSVPQAPDRAAIPLIEVRLSGEGRQIDTSKRYINGYLPRRLRYVRHEEFDREGAKFLDIETRDTKTGVQATNHFSVFSEEAVLRSVVEVRNSGTSPISLQAVSSLAIGGMTIGSNKYWNDWQLHFARNDWFREVQWQKASLPSVGLDDFGVESSRACFSLSNQGSFSTGGYLPMGALSRVDGKKTWLWQIESNGSWQWEIADYQGSVYMTAGGPTDQQKWTKRLQPGEVFSTVPVALAVVDDDFDLAVAELTQYRRRMRRKHEDNERLPVIFNDYMNCLMGDPTAEKVSALIAPAVKAGAEYFCIDCGWYADDKDGWWDSVGEWMPSQTRFPAGLKATLDEIKAAGMVPGLWLEPEVVGINSPVAAQLPNNAFFQRDGERVVEVGRYQLDFRHPATIERMNAVVDRLVNELGVGYFKFDYNIEVTQGTDVGSSSPGSGQLEHNRAYLGWVNSVFDRFPSLVIENCSSGGQRLDYAMLGTHPIQSTSDQTDPVRYAAIAASVPTGVTPEQSATWAYPQPSWSDETNVLTVVNALLGRMHLSGKLDELSEHQSKLISDGVAVYKRIRSDLRSAVPFWPLGLPEWSDNWIALGMNCGKRKYISVWCRRTSGRCMLPIRGFEGSDCHIECLYPVGMPGTASWQVSDGSLAVALPAAPSARLFEVSLEQV